MKSTLFISLAVAGIAAVSCVSSYEYVDPGSPSSYQYLVTSITFEEEQYDLAQGSTLTLADKLIISPSNASNKSVSWASSDTAFVTVTKNGEVLACKKGSATVTATATDGSCKKASATINVTE